jgi:hypothetical protein
MQTVLERTDTQTGEAADTFVVVQGHRAESRFFESPTLADRHTGRIDAVQTVKRHGQGVAIGAPGISQLHVGIMGPGSSVLVLLLTSIDAFLTVLAASRIDQETELGLGTGSWGVSASQDPARRTGGHPDLDQEFSPGPLLTLPRHVACLMSQR